jgi:cell pole-organizing protein PopZ
VKQDGEPSVEEILESIKKVIARDNRETADEERRRREAQGPGIRTFAVSEELDADDEAEVLDLDGAAEMAAEDGPAAGLTTERTAGAMRESLAALAMLAEPGVPPQIVRSGETSLEGLVRELLRPMLAQWLEANLPQIVDRMVQAEIARIAGKKG